MKKIIFPTDFSDTANHAREYASKVAKAFDAEILICHVVPNILIDPAHERFGDPTLFPSIQEVTTVLEKFDMDYRLAEKLEQELAFFKAKDITCSAYSSFGSVYDQVELMASEFNCDLVIIGTNGNTGMEQQLIGSNAYQVCKRSTIPVLTVRDAAQLDASRRILMASDFNPEEVGKVIEVAKMFKGAFDCRLDFLFVNTPSQFVETDDIERKFTEVKNRFGLEDVKLMVYNSMYLETGILRVAGSLDDLGLIVFGNHGYSRVKMTVEYSIADQLISRAEIPVLSVKI